MNCTTTLKLVFLSLLVGAICLPIGTEANQSQSLHPPLVTTCRVMPRVVADLNAALNNTGATCTLSTNCTQIQCGNILKRSTSFMIDIQICSDPLAINIVKYNETTRRVVFEHTLYKSQMLGMDLGFGFVTLNLTFVPRRTRLSLGVKVDEVDLSSGTSSPIVSRTEIPIDIYSCPGSNPPKSETCQVMQNIAQYLNYFFTGQFALESTPDCIPSTSCNDVICGFSNGAYDKISILACQNPPALQLVNVLPNMTVYYEHVTKSSEVVTFTPMPQISLNVTFKQISPSRVGLALSYSDSTRGNQSSTEIPYVVVPINRSTCASNYTRSMLVSGCDILPHLSSPECVIEGPGCNRTTCQVSKLDATIEVILYECLQSLDVGFVVRDRKQPDGQPLFSRRTPETLIFNDTRRNNSQVSFTVVQHASELSVGVQVTEVETGEVYIKYHELPVNRSLCPNLVQHPSTTTCEAMTYIAQYLNVFFANVTNDPESSPDCVTLEPNCNNITCTFIDHSYYSLSILPCVSPAVVHLEFHAPNRTAIFKHTFTSDIQRERLDANTQLEVTLGYAPDILLLKMIVLYNDGSYSFSLPAIPNVLIPLDTSSCKSSPPPPPEVTTMATPTPDTGIPKTTLLAIMIAAPVGGIMLFLICVMMCVIVCLCVRQSRLSNSRDNYNFQRLSIAAQDSDEEEEEDVEQG